MKLIDNQRSIQFTHEIEESQKTVFVDILIRGTEDSKINTTVFIKMSIKWKPDELHNAKSNMKESHAKLDFNLIV